jgi:hypothetical protein
MITLEHVATARPATVDALSSGTLVGKQIRLTGTSPYVTDNYLIIGAEPSHPDLSPRNLVIATTVTVNLSFAVRTVDYLIIRDRNLSTPMGNTAATFARSTRRVQRQFFAAPPSTLSAWCYGDKPTETIGVSITDRRLQPFYDRLDQIERGEWDRHRRGNAPSGEVIKIARNTLNAVSGDALIPARIVAAEGRIVIHFSAGRKFANIEILNRRDLMVMTSDGVNVPFVKGFTAPRLTSAIAQVRAHIA